MCNKKRRWRPCSTSVNNRSVSVGCHFRFFGTHGRTPAMTVQDIVAEIPRLTIEEQLVVLDAITQALRASMIPHRRVRESLVDRLYGAFKTDGPTPTDEDIDRMRYETLMEKHS